MARALWAAVMVSFMAGTAQAAEPVDPLDSPLWPEIRAQVLGAGPVVFDPRVSVTAPERAENSAHLPVRVRVDGLGRIKTLVLFADYNPIPKILALRPVDAEPFVATSFKINMASPVRAAALAEDGIWHVGGVWVDAAGGGCTLPSAASANAEWQSHLGEISARAWQKGPSLSRVKLRLIHPMDTGLAGGIPAFYLDRSTIAAADGRVLAEVETFEPVSENPVLVLELHGRAGTKGFVFAGRDIGGNEFRGRIREGGKAL